MSVVLSARAGDVVTVTINRADKMNALNDEVMNGLIDAIAPIETDPTVGAVVITGAGEKAFVAGADIAMMSGLTPEQAHGFASKGQSVFRRIETLGRPVIAAINGFALGGGCELALACTLRYASKNARLGQPEVNLGIMTGYAGSQRLPRVVGRGRALDLLLTGRQVGADEAFAMGLVNRVCETPADVVAEAQTTAAELAAKSRFAVRAQLAVTLAADDLPFDEAARMEAAYFGLAFSTSDAREGLAAFVEKRKPTFSGR
jgi:enoyl-CoA hydratase